MSWALQRQILVLRRSVLVCIALAVAAEPARAAEKPPLVVYAAASLTNVLDGLGAEYGRRTRVPVKFSFAASSLLAKQIEAGTKAAVFVLADQEWMDYLATRKLLRAGTRVDVAANRLVLVAPVDGTVQLKIAPNFPLAAALGNRRLATADPASVPAGRNERIPYALALDASGERAVAAREAAEMRFGVEAASRACG